MLGHVLNAPPSQSPNPPASTASAGRRNSPARTCSCSVAAGGLVSTRGVGCRSQGRRLRASRAAGSCCSMSPRCERATVTHAGVEPHERGAGKYETHNQGPLLRCAVRCHVRGASALGTKDAEGRGHLGPHNEATAPADERDCNPVGAVPQRAMDEGARHAISVPAAASSNHCVARSPRRRICLPAVELPQGRRQKRSCKREREGQDRERQRAECMEKATK